MILSLNFIYFSLFENEQFKGSFHTLPANVANISLFVMRYSSEVLHDNI